MTESVSAGSEQKRGSTFWPGVRLWRWIVRQAHGSAATDGTIPCIPTPPDKAPTACGLSADTTILAALGPALSRAHKACTDCVALILDGDPEGRGCDARLIRIRLRAALRTDDIVLPSDGGRFVILTRLTRSGAEAAALRMARRIAAVSSPDWGASSQFSGHLGVVPLPARQAPFDAAVVLGALNDALREASALGAGTIRVLSPPGPDAQTGPAQPPTVGQAVQKTKEPARTAVQPRFGAAQLATALDAGQFRAHFQPQISADTGALTGFEALARWNDPDHGLRQPAEFMDAIERAGLLRRLGEVILIQALDAMRIWQLAGYDVPGVSVNVTRQELTDPGYCQRLAWNLDRLEIPADRLVIEVLETVASDPARLKIVDNLTQLVELGCRLDLDDFGIGPGALDSLRDFPVHRIKIDRSFVSGCDHDIEQRRMLAAILSMAEHLDVETVGEGVETIAERGLLAQMGCDYLQGYAIARPMALSETTMFMERQKLTAAFLPRFG